MKLQSPRTQAAEVEIRREETAKEDPSIIIARLRPRLKEHHPLLDSAIQQREYPLVGEIGAGYCHIILDLIDRHNLHLAVAFDISPESLEFSALVSEELFTTHPARRLRFAPGDIYKEKGFDQLFDVLVIVATAHHFPDPRPLYQKAYTMLKPGGVLYINREPLRSWVGLHEAGRYKEWWTTMRQRSRGLLETQFSLKTWLEAFNIFESWDMYLKFPHLFNVSLKDMGWLKRFMVQLFGGRVYGVMTKE